MAGQKYQFGRFELDPGERLLSQDGQPSLLTPKVFDLLEYLVRNPKRLLPKEELLQALWPDTFVEEANLTVGISSLRRVLGDKAYIETVPKRGYRFTVEVHEIALAAPAPPRVDLVETAVPVPPPLPAVPQRQGRHGWLVALIVALGLMAVATWAALHRRPVSTGPASVAILPFQDLSGARSEDAYLGIGMADALILRLTNLKQVVVRSTQEIQRFKTGATDPASAGKQLGVDWVLTGSLQHTGNRVRVSAQLVRVADRATVWAEKFDESFTNIFAVQDLISGQLARSLALRLSPSDQREMAKRYTEDTEAYRLYAQGRYEMSRGDTASVERAARALERSAEKDPSYPLPHAELARAYALLFFRDGRQAEYGRMARQSIAKALELDPDLALAHSAAAIVEMFVARDPAAAEGEHRRAIELTPNSADTHYYYGQFLHLNNRLAESETEYREAFQLNPMRDFAGLNLGYVLFERGKTQEALEQLQASRTRLSADQEISNFGATHGIIRCLVKLGKTAEAEQELRAVAKRFSRMPQTPFVLASVYASLGRLEEAKRTVQPVWNQREQRGTVVYAAATALALGQAEEAFRLLHRAVDVGDADVRFVRGDPDFQALAGDPRWSAFLSRLSGN